MNHQLSHPQARQVVRLAPHKKILHVNLGGQTGNRIVYTLTQEEIQ